MQSITKYNKVDFTSVKICSPKGNNKASHITNTKQFVVLIDLISISEAKMEMDK